MDPSCVCFERSVCALCGEALLAFLLEVQVAEAGEISFLLQGDPLVLSLLSGFPF